MPLAQHSLMISDISFCVTHIHGARRTAAGVTPGLRHDPAVWRSDCGAPSGMWRATGSLRHRTMWLGTGSLPHRSMSRTELSKFEQMYKTARIPLAWNFALP